MASFVLVHGALHGGWCWDEIVPRLEAAGHKAIAPNMPGLAGDPTPHDQVTLKMTADFAAGIVRDQPAPVILAGHSLGGSVISEVAERIPERIASLVYVCAMLLPNGTSVMGAGTGNNTREDSQVSADGHSVWFDPVAARDLFYNLSPKALVDKAAAHLTPQPLGPVITPITVTEARFGRVPRAYIECTKDNAIPIAMQRQMHAAQPCDPVFTLETDHSPFLSTPQALTDCLLAVAAKYVS
jgi:pimeloyl-ACP methyl ester carboxylesterase